MYFVDVWKKPEAPQHKLELVAARAVGAAEASFSED
jgi:hypothetical protein